MSDYILNNRIMIAATGSGCGKTTVTTGLLYLLKDKGFDVHCFKCGPDYIDPMYHETVLGIPSKNLDPFFLDDNLLRTSFLDGMGQVNIVEACMGLYDGMGTSSDYSSYSVACALHMPIILTVDCHGMGYSIVAIIKGFLSLDTNHLIKGIFLNQVSETYARKLAQTIYDKTGLYVVGYLPKNKDIELSSRHLGLKMAEENNAISKIQIVADMLSNTLDFERFFSIHEASEEITCNKLLMDYVDVDLSDTVIAVALDEAFNFYYRDNIKALELAGASIKYFSPIRDKHLPEKTTAIYIGGGYPENYLNELSANNILIEEIRAAIEKDVPVFAECGGFMYLNETIESNYMCGIFNDHVFRTKGLVRFGYVNIKYNDYVIKGHEFHHYDVSNTGDICYVEKASTHENYLAFRKYKRCLAGFPHMFFFSCPKFLEVFK